MKHPLLCMVLTLVLVVMDGRPFDMLGAAEIWNSQSGQRSSGEKRTIYNKPKNSNAGKGVTTLYNRQSTSNARVSSRAGLQAQISTYAQIVPGQQVPSKLWGLLSPQALLNKQADVDHALQKEYDRKSKTAVIMAKMLRESEALRLEGERKHQEDVARYHADKDAYEAARQAEKERALRGRASGRVYTASNKKRVYKGRAGENRTVLKKPKRLFNDPNR